MKRAVGAVLWQCTAFDDGSFLHRFCPADEDERCKWQHDKIDGKKTYKMKSNIQNWLHYILKSMFMDLSSDYLLLKYLQWQTVKCQ